MASMLTPMPMLRSPIMASDRERFSRAELTNKVFLCIRPCDEEFTIRNGVHPAISRRKSASFRNPIPQIAASSLSRLPLLHGNAHAFCGWIDQYARGNIFKDITVCLFDAISFRNDPSREQFGMNYVRHARIEVEEIYARSGLVDLFYRCGYGGYAYKEFIQDFIRQCRTHLGIKVGLVRGTETLLQHLRAKSVLFEEFGIPVDNDCWSEPASIAVLRQILADRGNDFDRVARLVCEPFLEEAGKHSHSLGCL